MSVVKIGEIITQVHALTGVFAIESTKSLCIQVFEFQNFERHLSSNSKYVQCGGKVLIIKVAPNSSIYLQEFSWKFWSSEAFFHGPKTDL
jgi:hypothetical protein